MLSKVDHHLVSTIVKGNNSDHEATCNRQIQILFDLKAVLLVIHVASETMLL